MRYAKDFYVNPIKRLIINEYVLMKTNEPTVLYIYICYHKENIINNCMYA